MGLLLFAFAISVARLDSASVFNDEYHSVRHTGFLEIPNSIPQIVESVATTSAQHVPFYFILLSRWIALAGFDPVTMRLLSVFPFLLAIALSYQLGKQLFDDSFGRWFAFFMTTSGFAIFFSHQIRMYSFILFFCIWLVWSYWRVSMSLKPASIWDWLGLWCASVLLVYTHYVGAFALVTVGLYHLLRFSWQRRWWTVVLVEVLAGATFLPWLNIFIEGATTRKDLSDNTLSFLESIYHIVNIASNGFFIVGLLLIVLSLYYFRNRKQTPLFILFVGLLSVLAIPLINQVVPILPVDRMRYIMAILPFTFLLFALGVQPLVEKWSWVGIVLVIAGCFTGATFQQNPMLDVYTNRASKQFSAYPPYHVYAREIPNFPGFDEPLITVDPDIDVMHNVRTFYSQWLGLELTHIWNEPDEELAPLVDLRLDIIQDELSILVAHKTDVDMADVPAYQHVIADLFKPCQTIFTVDDVQVDYYVRDIVPCELITEREELPLAVYEDGLRLENLLIVPQDDDYYRVYSWWDRTAVRDVPLGFDFRIVDDNGNEIKKFTNTMPPKSIGFNDMDLSDLPSGTYELRLIVFNLENGLPILLGDESQYFRVRQVDIVEKSG